MYWSERISLFGTSAYQFNNFLRQVVWENTCVYFWLSFKFLKQTSLNNMYENQTGAACVLTTCKQPKGSAPCLLEII